MIIFPAMLKTQKSERNNPTSDTTFVVNPGKAGAKQNGLKLLRPDTRILR